MKNLSKLAAAATFSLSAFAVALPASAASYNITSTYLAGLPDCAVSGEQPVAVAGGCKYESLGSGTSYIFGAGDYTLGENITFDSQEQLVFDGASSFDLSGKTLSGGDISNFDGVIKVKSGILTISGGTISGRTNVAGGTVTINNLTNTGTTNITGGTVVINSGIFSADMESAIYAGGASNITINGGTFTSAQDKGLEAIHWGDDTFDFSGVLKINGGTFTGNTHGLLVGDSSQTPNITLAGGTFKYTGTNETFGAIGVSSLDEIPTSVLNDLLASGYSYSDATATVASEYIYTAVLTGRSVTVTGGNIDPDDQDSESASTDDSTTGSSSSTTSVGTPDSGFSTNEGASATAAGGLMTAVLLSLIGAGLWARRRA